MLKLPAAIRNHIYSSSKPFDKLGQIVYQRTYSRQQEDGSFEAWPDTVNRVLTGTFQMQKEFLGWHYEHDIAPMAKCMSDLKFLPPGRGLWAMGSPMTTEKGVWAALNNCGFVSTRDVHLTGADPFCFLMDS
jgi:ribonucleoside-triphosphate reductase